MWFALLLLLALASGSSLGAEAADDPQLIAALTQSFTSEDWDFKIARKDFKEKVRKEDRFVVLSKMWESANTAPYQDKRTRIQGNVLTFLVTDNAYDWASCRELEAQIYASVTASDDQLRGHAFYLIVRSHSNTEELLRPILFIFLNDKNDELRTKALEYNSKFTDSEKVMKLHIREHEADPAYAKSVAAAKRMLAFREKQKNVEK